MRNVFLFVALAVALAWSPFAARAQDVYIGLRVRPSVGGVFAEFVRYGDKDSPQEGTIVERRTAYRGSAWAARTELGGTWWVTNAHVAALPGGGWASYVYAILDKQKRWWYPNGKLYVKTAAKVLLTVIKSVARDDHDLAGMFTGSRIPELTPVTDLGLMPGTRLVVVGNPLGLRLVVTEGMITQEADEDFDVGDLHNNASHRGWVRADWIGQQPPTKPDPSKDPKITADIFLFSAVITFGSSGSAVVDMNMRTIGVVRGFLTSGTRDFPVGAPYPYAIAGRHVVEFVRELK